MKSSASRFRKIPSILPDFKGTLFDIFLKARFREIDLDVESSAMSRACLANWLATSFASTPECPFTQEVTTSVVKEIQIFRISRAIVQIGPQRFPNSSRAVRRNCFHDR
ncbi:hypothetical protein AVEN_209728-1 [Araneus ventricosus]|uniref:Uncharacterized protein n=1 Tax=Araneus ventricosus TaxID=182803 RepID=A0A4Y2CCR3_ARAVE|nr:hypothetical protein AVEN_209728-1 [Araneus ventricosus]